VPRAKLTNMTPILAYTAVARGYNDPMDWNKECSDRNVSYGVIESSEVA